MIITYWNGVFVADSNPEDRVALERAGFESHEPTLCRSPACRACRAKIGRRYWSSKVEVATRLKAHCNSQALKMMQDHLEKLKKSRAVSANISVPHPNGLSFRPYQLAGIAYASQHKDTLVADDPGLGKTIISLGFVNYIKARSVLVVAPATLSYNWITEARLWLSDRWTIFVPKTGDDPAPTPAPGENLMVVTTYEKIAGRKR